tara:strand:+ start:57 stop:338 length:282 start_codon:yes stop_codon:yes gene_type:complete
MENNNEKIFTDGMIVKRNDNAPDFVISNISIKVEEFTKFLGKHNKNGWVNIDVLKSKNGKYYGQINNWQPNQNDVITNTNTTSNDNQSDDLPF